MMPKLTFRIVAALLAGLLVVGFLMWGPQACNNYFSQKKQIRVEKGQAGAGMKSAEDAIGKIDENAGKVGEIDSAVAEGKEEIRASPDGNSNKAATSASCKLKSYRDTPQCKALQPKSGEPK